MSDYQYQPILSEEQVAQYRQQRRKLERVAGSCLMLAAGVMLWIHLTTPGDSTNTVLLALILIGVIPMSIAAMIEGNKPNCHTLSASDQKKLSGWRQDFPEIDARVAEILSQRQDLTQHEFTEIQKRVEALEAHETRVNSESLQSPEKSKPKSHLILAEFPKTGSLWLLFTTVVFLGLNLFVWAYSRAKAFNKVLNKNSPKPISLRLLAFGMGLYVAGFIQSYVIAKTILPHAAVSSVASNALVEQVAPMMLMLMGLLIGGLACLVTWLFIFRTRLHALLDVSYATTGNSWWPVPKDPRWIDASFLLCFHVFYLNYKMNRIRAGA